MKKLDEIKAFIQKNATVMAELAQLTQHDFLYSSSLTEEIIEKQQGLRHHARRLGVLSVDKPFFEEAELSVLIKFEAFCSFVNLEECTEKEFMNEGKKYYCYSTIIDNIVLKAVKRDANEEHKKAQAI